jgi:hypothetical protein
MYKTRQAIKLFLIFAIGYTFFAACKTKAKKDELIIYPITESIAKDIKLADSLGKPYFYKKTENGKTDSLPFGKEEFKKFTEAFTSINLSHPKFSNDYVEKTFIDETQEYATFIYEAKPGKKPPFNEVHVNMNKTTGQLKKIYLLTENGNGRVRKYWSFGSNASIITITDQANGAASTKVETVSW